MAAKKPKKPNWTKIQTEYVTGRISQRDLAKKHGVSYSVLAARCRDEGWVALRQEHRSKTVAKACDAISNQQAGQMSALVTEAATALLQKAMLGIEQVDRPTVTHKETVKDGGLKSTTEWETMSDKPGAVNVAAVRHLATALKDIAGVLGLETELDRELKEARIAALRADTEAKRDNGGDGSEVVVTFDAGPEEWNE